MKMTISGEYLTEMSRNLVLNGNWEGAIRVLSEGNEGQLEAVLSILKGDSKLIGINENISLVSDNDLEYKNEILKVYAGSCYIDEKWVKPYATVNTITKKTSLSDQRILFYKEESDHVYQVIEVNGKKTAVLFRESEYEDEEGLIPPIWLQSKYKESIAANVQEFLSYGNLLLEYGVTKQFFYDTADMSAEDKSQKNFLKYMAAMKDNHNLISREAFEYELDARNEMLDLFLVPYCKEKIEAQETEWIQVDEFRIPKTPFMYWARKVLNITDIEYNVDWIPVSSPGQKMCGDNPFHTDWVIGAGLDPYNFYNSKEEKIINNFVFSLSRRKLLCVNGSGTVSGRITKDPALVTKDHILVIPHAGVEYFEAAKNAGAVIAAVGGPASHLVVNSKEHEIKFALVLNAIEEFEEGEFVTIIMELGKFLHKSRLNLGEED